MKKLVCIAFLIMGGFGLSAQGNMDVYNFTGDILLVQARATVNGTVVGYSRAMVMPNASAVIPSVSNDPNAVFTGGVKYFSPLILLVALRAASNPIDVDST